ncbi:isochorismatase family cysteine hydrolase [Ferroplasma sp.]|uniref:isochorismatase family cysteine hydrolase n=1 Tax=Ferroplasma sp. TaxID=2591003 RepID=UPI00307ED093
MEANKSCILIIDMINDFVTGKFGNKNAVKAVELAEKTLIKINGNIPVIFAGDAHINNDPEFLVWGEHALDGTDGSKIVKSLSKFPDYVIKKRHFDAFYDTDLDSLLRALNIKNIYIFGISTDICVEHTCAGAFYRYYNVKVISDLCACIDDSKQISSINNIKINYGYNHITAEELIKEVYK